MRGSKRSWRLASTLIIGLIGSGLTARAEISGTLNLSGSATLVLNQNPPAGVMVFNSPPTALPSSTGSFGNLSGLTISTPAALNVVNFQLVSNWITIGSGTSGFTFTVNGIYPPSLTACGSTPEQPCALGKVDGMTLPFTITPTQTGLDAQLSITGTVSQGSSTAPFSGTITAHVNESYSQFVNALTTDINGVSFPYDATFTVTASPISGTLTIGGSATLEGTNSPGAVLFTNTPQVRSPPPNTLSFANVDSNTQITVSGVPLNGPFPNWLTVVDMQGGSFKFSVTAFAPSTGAPCGSTLTPGQSCALTVPGAAPGVPPITVLSSPNPGIGVTLSFAVQGTVSDGNSTSFFTSVFAGTTQTTYENLLPELTGTGVPFTYVATLIVTTTPAPAPPTLTMTFGSPSIQQGGNTTLTFNVANPNTSTQLTSVGLTDTLSDGLTVAAPNMESGACGGGTITATPGSSTITLANATLGGGQSCTFSVEVTGATTGMKSSSAIVSGVAGTNTVAAGPMLASLNVTSGGPLTISAPPDLGPIGTGPGAAACGVTIPLSTLGTPTVHPANPADNVTVTTAGIPANNFYPTGVITITWKATEGDQTAQATQTMTVKDTTPPTLTLPPSITVLAAGSTTLPPASLTATAADNCPGTVTVTSAPPSTYSFPQGSTTVTYTATDAASNKSTGTQTVTVTNQPGPFLQQLVTQIAAVPQNVRRSLLAHVTAAILAVSRNNKRGACMQINAFVNEVKRQTGITISAALAGELTLTAGQAQGFLGCAL